MKNTLLLFFAFLTLTLNGQEILSIQNKLIDRNGGSIPFASIINVTTNSYGTTSDEQGNFLLKTRDNLNDQIQINALGFYELRVNLGEFLKLNEKGRITLKEKPIDLGEIEVNGERYEQNFIGKSTDLLINENGKIHSDIIGDQPGLSEGVLVKPNKRTSGLLDKIHFYVTDDAVKESNISVRLLRSPKKLKNNQGYKLDEFEDMLDSLLIIKNFEAGWNSYDLYDLDIPLDGSSFFILFTNLETVDESKQRRADETLEGVSFATFADRKAKEIYKALYFNGILVYLANDRVRTPIPAVYIEYSDLKK